MRLEEAQIHQSQLVISYLKLINLKNLKTTKYKNNEERKTDLIKLARSHFFYQYNYYKMTKRKEIIENNFLKNDEYHFSNVKLHTKSSKRTHLHKLLMRHTTEAIETQILSNLRNN